MKIFPLIIPLFFLLNSSAQNCDSTITIYFTERQPGEGVTVMAIEVDSVRNGLVASRSLNGSVFEQNSYDSLNRLTERILNGDSIVYSYDLNSRLSSRDYYRQVSNIWQYKNDTSRVEYFYSSHGLDSIIKFRWDGTTMNAFHRFQQFYTASDTLIGWRTERYDSTQWVLDSIATITYPTLVPDLGRIDSVFNDSLSIVNPYLIIYYDTLYRITRIDNMQFEYYDRYQEFEYQCNQLSGWHSSCYGCHSGNYNYSEFDIECRILRNVHGHYSTSDDHPVYIDEYYYAGCSTLLARTPEYAKICKGDSVNIAAASFGGTPPWQIQWSPTQGMISDTSFITKASPDSSTNYIITVTDSNGLTARDTMIFEVVNPPQANLYIESIDTISNCHSAVLAADSLNGYHFGWIRDSLYFGYYSHKNIVYNGTYIVQVYLDWPNYGICPIANDTLVFNYFSNPAPFVSLSRGCNEVYAHLSAPAQIQWFFNGQAIADSSRDTLTVSQSGSYGAIITDSLGCSSPVLSSIYYQALEVVTTPRSTCADSCNGRISSQPYNNLQYSWSNGATTSDITGLCNGIYSATVTDNFGCTVSVSDTISDFQRANIYYLNSGTSSALACDGFVIPVDSTNKPYNASYIWENNNGGFTLDSLCAGWHTVMTRPYFSACPQLDSFYVSPAFSADTCSVVVTQTNPSCSGNSNGSITISSSTGSPFACIWYSTNVYSNYLLTQQWLLAGIYSCMIIDQNGCIDSADITLLDPQPLTLNLTAIQNQCQDSCLLTAIVSGGIAPYRYSWCNNQTSSQILYCGEQCGITVWDANNCHVQSTVQQPLVFPLTFQITNTPTSCITCNDGIMIISTSGGTPPYSYSVDGGSSTYSDTITGLSSGYHSICVIGADSCSACLTHQILVSINSIYVSKLLQVYPNPSHDHLFFAFKEFKPGFETRLIISDVLGRIVKDFPVPDTNFELPGVSLSSGVYIFHLMKSDGVSEKGRIVVE